LESLLEESGDLFRAAATGSVVYSNVTIYFLLVDETSLETV